MSDYGPGRGSPVKLVGALVVIGLLGRHGQTLLTGIRRAARGVLLISIAVIVYTVAVDGSALLFVIACSGALVAGLMWCYAAFAQWLTRDQPAEDD